MKDYSQGKIYKIIDETNGDVYIGSTTQTLKRRYQTHQIFRDYNKLRCNCKIILIEDYPCNSKRELEKREQYHIDNNKCINKTNSIDKNDMEKRRKQVRIANGKRLEELRPYKNEWHTQRIRYEKTWGGDKRFHNNLLMIDVNLFLCIHGCE